MAIDGAAGIASAIQNRPDLILMDASLPGMDGWEATRVLRSQSETAFIPISALTAHAMEIDRRRSIEVGCNDHDTKPIDLAPSPQDRRVVSGVLTRLSLLEHRRSVDDHGEGLRRTWQAPGKR